MENYEVIIGLEVHVELLTKSKMFCGCPTQFGSTPNTHVCPVCLGMPGVLPVINFRAIELAIKTALAFNSKISEFSRFSRKNYFYPDLPKNYQISQYAEPVATGGFLTIEDRRIHLTRIHLEEDAGKLLHSEREANFSLVDFNRTGIPLLEIVTEPDIRSPEEAEKFLEKLKQNLEYLNISDCNMEEGSLRCDANISVKKKEEKNLGVKTEVKNMNSFKGVRKALAFEIKRQLSVLKEGEKIKQETRLWNEKLQTTEEMRSKEEAHDYRYFPEPDLVPLNINDDLIEKIKLQIVELPEERQKRFQEKYKLSVYDSKILTSKKEISDYFEECIKLHPHLFLAQDASVSRLTDSATVLNGAHSSSHQHPPPSRGRIKERGKENSKSLNNPKILANWIMGDLMALLKERKTAISLNTVKPSFLVELIKFIVEGKITRNIGKEVLKESFDTGKTPSQIIQEKNLVQIQDKNFLENMVAEIIKENPKTVDDFKKGKEKALGFLLGQVMKKTKGKADHQKAQQILKELIEKN